MIEILNNSEAKFIIYDHRCSSLRYLESWKFFDWNHSEYKNVVSYMFCFCFLLFCETPSYKSLLLQLQSCFLSEHQQNWIIRRIKFFFTLFRRPTRMYISLLYYSRAKFNSSRDRKMNKYRSAYKSDARLWNENEKWWTGNNRINPFFSPCALWELIVIK